MKNERPVGHDRFQSLLRLSGDAVLVGGQSLVVWAHHFGIEPRYPLIPFISNDVDFLAGRHLAEEIAGQLGGKLFVPKIDDHVIVNTAVVTFGVDEDYERVDFLANVAGMDSRKIRERAIAVKAWNIEIHVMHPVDCLESRIHNLDLLPEKRNDVGIAQANLAIEIVRALIEEVLQRGEERHALKLAEHIGYLSRSREAANAFVSYGIEVLHAVPIDLMPAGFQAKRWPQLQKYAKKKMQKKPGSSR